MGRSHPMRYRPAGLSASHHTHSTPVSLSLGHTFHTTSCSKGESFFEVYAVTLGLAISVIECIAALERFQKSSHATPRSIAVDHSAPVAGINTKAGGFRREARP
jgi:hypothetical protein